MQSACQVAQEGTIRLRQHFLAEAVRILDCLPISAQRSLRKMRTRCKPASVEQALLVLFICDRYRTGWGPDRLAAHVHAAGLFSAETSEDVILRQLVLPVRLAFLACQLPIARYWSLTEPFIDFLFYHLMMRVRSGHKQKHIEKDLRVRWTAGQTDVYLSEAATREEISCKWIIEKNRWATRCAKRWLVESPVRTTVEQRVRSLPPGITRRIDLRGLVSLATRLNALKAASESRDDLKQTRSAAELERNLAVVKRWLGGLFFWERDLLLQPRPDDALIEQCLRLMPLVKRESSDYSNEKLLGVPAEAIGGEEYIPNWLQDYVFSMGGRFSQNSLGPLPYLFVALDPHEYPNVPAKIGVLPPRCTPASAILPIRLVEDSGDDGQLDFIFPLKSPESLRTLMLVVATSGCRFDILKPTQLGTLSKSRSMWIELPTSVLGKLKKAAIGALKRYYDSDPTRMRDALARNTQIPVPLVGFVGFEQAKSQQLLMDTARFPANIPRGRAADLWRQYGESRQRIHCLELKRVELLDLGKTIAAKPLVREIACEKARIVVLQQKVRGRDPARFRKYHELDRIEDSAEGVLQKGTCFLHLGFSRSTVDGFFTLGGTGLAVSRIHFPDFKIGPAVNLVNQWLESETQEQQRKALDQIVLEFGKTIGTPLAAQLGAAGVRRVIASPSWFLQLVPLHCLRVNAVTDGDYLGNLFDGWSYSSSLRLLKRANIIRSRKHSAAAFSYSPPHRPLAGVTPEARMVQLLMPPCALFEGETATPEQFSKSGHECNVLHAACHADWVADDALRSGLLLAEQSGRSPKLSAATILASDAFHGVSLVTLSACSTGRHVQRLHTFQEYLGLDGILMAQGVRAVVSTLWSVDDLAAFLVMSRFYWELSTGISVGDALRIATDQLSRGFLTQMPRDIRFKELLTRVMPNWEPSVKRADARLRHPMAWGAFRCSGISWKPIVKGSGH
jgi:CHAT domain-containing protein